MDFLTREIVIRTDMLSLLSDIIVNIITMFFYTAVIYKLMDIKFEFRLSNILLIVFFGMSNGAIGNIIDTSKDKVYTVFDSGWVRVNNYQK